MSNPYRRFLDLLPARPVQIGVVSDIVSGTATVDLIDGNSVQARGNASIGDRVFVRDGLIEGTAPDLPLEVIEV